MSDQPTGKAVAAFVFGVLSFAGLPCIGAIAAILLGRGEQSGIGRAGVILGWINLVLSILCALGALIALFVIAASDHH